VNRVYGLMFPRYSYDAFASIAKINRTNDTVINA
jgi:hypothetical protein